MLRCLCAGAFAGVFLSGAALAQDVPLPSWHEGAAKQAIISFVEAVTTEGGADFVPTPERVAVFDNDGTLWTEQPAYFQLFFTIHRLQAMAPENPDWENTEPFASVLQGDLEGTLAAGEEGLVAMMAAAHTGMTTQEFAAAVRDWLNVGRHPVSDRPFTEMVYQPMIEVLDYLRANGFKTYIVSGGGVDFMRVFAEEIYGIPPEQTIGTAIEKEYRLVDGVPTIFKTAAIDLVDDGPGKPVGIDRHIGRKPIAAFGNSDGDLQMLQYTCLPEGPDFCLYVHHTDATREFAYDRDSSIGKLDEGLTWAEQENWTVVDMARDWAVIHPE